MKLVTFARDGVIQPGLARPGGVVPIGDLVPNLRRLIDQFDRLRPDLERRLADGQVVRPERVLAPLVPDKILCSTNLYASQAEPTPLLMTLKSSESIIGPGADLRLPDTFEAWDFFPEAELGLVIKGPAKQVSAANWQSAVFGYTCVIDVMARGGDPNFGRDYWVAKADGLCPIGGWITTIDEIPDPHRLRVQSWQNGELAQDYSTADGQYTLGAQIELATSVMTLYSGDVVACGTCPQGARPLADGDQVMVEIEGLGPLGVGVTSRARVVA